MGRRWSLADYEAAEARGECECGLLLDAHPPLDLPKDWGHGRPCDRSAVERASKGWGTLSSVKAAPGRGIQVTRPATPQPANEPAAWAGYHLVPRHEVMAALRRNEGDVARTAREVGLSTQRIYQIRRAALEAIS